MFFTLSQITHLAFIFTYNIFSNFLCTKFIEIKQLHFTEKLLLKIRWVTVISSFKIRYPKPTSTKRSHPQKISSYKIFAKGTFFVVVVEVLALDVTGLELLLLCWLVGTLQNEGFPAFRRSQINILKLDLTWGCLLTAGLKLGAELRRRWNWHGGHKPRHSHAHEHKQGFIWKKKRQVERKVWESQKCKGEGELLTL